MKHNRMIEEIYLNKIGYCDCVIVTTLNEPLDWTFHQFGIQCKIKREFGLR